MMRFGVVDTGKLCRQVAGDDFVLTRPLPGYSAILVREGLCLSATASQKATISILGPKPAIPSCDGIQCRHSLSKQSQVLPFSYSSRAGPK